MHYEQEVYVRAMQISGYIILLPLVRRAWKLNNISIYELNKDIIIQHYVSWYSFTIRRLFGTRL